MDVSVLGKREAVGEGKKEGRGEEGGEKGEGGKMVRKREEREKGEGKEERKRKKVEHNNKIVVVWGVLAFQTTVGGVY